MSRKKSNLFIKQSLELGEVICKIASGNMPFTPSIRFGLGRQLNPEGLDQTIKNIPLSLEELDRSSESSFIKEAVLHLTRSLGVNLITAVTISSILSPDLFSERDIMAWRIAFNRLLKKGWNIRNFQNISSSQLDQIWQTYLESKQELMPPRPSPTVEIINRILSDLTDFGQHPDCPGLFFSLPPRFRPLGLSVGTSTKADVYQLLETLDVHEISPEEEGICFKDDLPHPSITSFVAYFSYEYAGIQCDEIEFIFFDGFLSNISLYPADEADFDATIVKIKDYFGYPPTQNHNGTNGSWKNIIWDFTFFCASVHEHDPGEIFINIYDPIKNRRSTREQEHMVWLNKQWSESNGHPTPTALQESVLRFKPFGILVGSSSEDEVRQIISRKFGPEVESKFMSHKNYPFLKYPDIGYRDIPIRTQFNGIEFDKMSFVFLKKRLWWMGLSKQNALPEHFYQLQDLFERYYLNQVTQVTKRINSWFAEWDDIDINVKLLYLQNLKMFGLAFSHSEISNLPIIPEIGTAEVPFDFMFMILNEKLK